MNSPESDELVARIVARLDADALEAYEERAALIEEGNSYNRRHAEALALIDLLQRQPWWLTGLIALQIDLDGATQWLLTTDLVFARHHLADIGADEIDLLAPADVVSEQYGGIAQLSTVG